MEPIYSTFTIPCEKFKTISLNFLIMKNIVVFPECSRFPEKLMDYFEVLLQCLHLLQPAYSFPWSVHKQVTSFVVIFLACGNFRNTAICSYIIFYWLIKKVEAIDHEIVVFYFYLWKKIFCLSCSDCSILKW